MSHSEITIEACARCARSEPRLLPEHRRYVQPSWDDAPDWQKSSAKNGVEGVFAGNGPRESHASWLAEKEANGWKYGPTKDPEKKEHPCFVEYDALPPEQKRKDSIFVNVVRTVGAARGATIVYPALPATETSPATECKTIDWSAA